MVSATKKKTGRPATGIGTPVQVRLHPKLLAMLDRYIARHVEPLPSRPETIRAILSEALMIKFGREELEEIREEKRSQRPSNKR